MGLWVLSGFLGAVPARLTAPLQRASNACMIPATGATSEMRGPGRLLAGVRRWILSWGAQAPGQWWKCPVGGWHSLSISSPSSSAEPQLRRAAVCWGSQWRAQHPAYRIWGFLSAVFFLPTLNLQVLNIRKDRKCCMKIAGQKFLVNCSQGGSD